MSWYALEEIEEAAKRARGLLLPFDWKLWAKIAVMAFFVGGASFPGLFPGTGGFESESGQNQGATFDADLQGFSAQSVSDLGVGAWVLVAAAMVMALVLVFGVLKAVFEFVYYQSLIDDNVRIRRNFVEHFTKGLRLFLFEIVSVILFMILFVALIVPIAVSPFFFIATFLLGIPLVIVAVIFFQFTTDFIPLYMIENDQGVIASWRQLYNAIIDEWRQLGLYLVVKIALGLMAQIAIGTAALLLGLLLIIPVGVPVFILYLVFPPLAIVAGLIGFVAWILGILYFLNGPATTFFRYYSLLVYNDITQVEEVEK